ncbi:hypothetical protein Y032_0341g3007 [Ancylostoma ceylanicum]|uniref:PAN domain protein n=1 Tax=Ancylostoma ceylanicum TaxID=53326 RepID=A0A016RY06_9BILA|nr:hypothetical protein Y032_0341g3007 [Ancylostoma ceylanicum]
MIIRLLLYLLPLTFVKPEENPECAIRVDILDGADLVEGVATFLTEKSTVLTAMHCATECFRKKCDVAYFHQDTRECRFTADSASSTATLPCNDVVAVEHKEGVDVLDKVKRFCMRCRGFKVSGGRGKFNDDNTLVQVHSNTVEVTPTTMRVVRPKTPRVRLFLPTTPLKVAVPPRPKVSQSQQWYLNNRVDALATVETLPTRTYQLARPYFRHTGHASQELQRVDESAEVKRAILKEPSFLRLPPSPVSTLRPIRVRPRLHKQRHRKMEGFSFKKDLYKMALLERASLFNGAALRGTVRYMRKKKRGFGNAR